MPRTSAPGAGRRRLVVAAAAAAAAASLVPAAPSAAQDRGPWDRGGDRDRGWDRDRDRDDRRGPFDFREVVEEARREASRPYAEPRAEPLPESLSRMDYDAYRRVQFRSDMVRGEWGDGRLRLRLYPRGYLYAQPVEVRIVDRQGRDRPVRFRRDWFDGVADDPAFRDRDPGYGGAGLDWIPDGGGAPQPLITFLGASYFRARGLEDASFGVSARGLALGSGRPGEEFPRFRKLWFVRPERGETSATVFALLDGPSVTGAYRFDIAPGGVTHVDVDSVLFARTRLDRIGIAPLTSMFHHGKMNPGHRGDFRPQVHDSDGLLLADGTGEWIFRPLRNPASVQISSFRLQSPRGFGLVQRDRDYDHYQDLEALYHARPSAWVRPRGDWGRGEVVLVELPAENEGVDNVVAYWRSEKIPAAAEEVRVRYALHFGRGDPDEHVGGRAVATRVRRSGGDGARLFVDFEGGRLAQTDPARPPEAVVSSTGGRVGQAYVQHVPYTRGWRVFFDVRRDGWSSAEPWRGDRRGDGRGPDGRVHDGRRGGPVELRVFLRGPGGALTETWSFPWEE